MPFKVRFPIGDPSSLDDDEADKEESHQKDIFLTYNSKRDVNRDSDQEHEWYWIKNQKPEEVLIIRIFDSEAERDNRGVAGGTMPSSVYLEGTEEEEARESVEVRCLVIQDRD